MDDLTTFETGARDGSSAPTRYAIRQALDQEYQKYLVRQDTDARQARYKAGSDLEQEPNEPHDRTSAKGPTAHGSSKPTAVKRDFFGRVLEDVRPTSREGPDVSTQAGNVTEGLEDRKVWVSFHEGFSNAVRKPITLEELMRGF